MTGSEALAWLHKNLVDKYPETTLIQKQSFPGGLQLKIGDKISVVCNAFTHNQLEVLYDSGHIKRYKVKEQELALARIIKVLG